MDKQTTTSALVVLLVANLASQALEVIVTPAKMMELIISTLPMAPQYAI